MSFRQSIANEMRLGPVYNRTDENNHLFSRGRCCLAADPCESTSRNGIRDRGRLISRSGIKTFQKTCPSVTVTTRQDNADYSVMVSDDGSGAARKGRSAVASTVFGKIVL